jgi:hypothetical protein
MPSSRQASCAADIQSHRPSAPPGALRRSAAALPSAQLGQSQCFRPRQSDWSQPTTKTDRRGQQDRPDRSRKPPSNSTLSLDRCWPLLAALEYAAAFTREREIPLTAAG